MCCQYFLCHCHSHDDILTFRRIRHRFPIPSGSCRPGSAVPALVSILQWRHIEIFLKTAAEMFYILISYGIGYILNGHITVFQQHLCFFHTDSANMLSERLAGFVLDILGDIRL